MEIRQVEFFQGKSFEIVEMILKNIDNQLELIWKICFENEIFMITFYNVSSFRVSEVSNPIVIQGFEIINNSPNGWEKDFTYEIRDFEDDRVNFFCEHFKLGE